MISFLFLLADESMVGLTAIDELFFLGADDLQLVSMEVIAAEGKPQEPKAMLMLMRDGQYVIGNVKS